MCESCRCAVVGASKISARPGSRLLFRLQPCRHAPLLVQFEREKSRVLGKELLDARQRWRATEAERAAAEDARRLGMLLVHHTPDMWVCVALVVGVLLLTHLLCFNRVEEAAAKAREELRRQREEQQKYQQVCRQHFTHARRMSQAALATPCKAMPPLHPCLQAAAKEAERLRQAKEAERKAFEEQQVRACRWSRAAVGVLAVLSTMSGVAGKAGRRDCGTC